MQSRIDYFNKLKPGLKAKILGEYIKRYDMSLTDTVKYWENFDKWLIINKQPILSKLINMLYTEYLKTSCMDEKESILNQVLMLKTI